MWNDGARLELLAKLIDDYERERFAFRKPDPIDAILFRMEEQGLRQADIAAIVGGKNRASEIASPPPNTGCAGVEASGRDDEPPGNWRQTSKLGSDPDHLALRPDR